MPGNVRTPGPQPVSPIQLWAVRIAAAAGPVIVSVVLILIIQALDKEGHRKACAPSGRWLYDFAHAAGLLFAIAASLPACLLILWLLAGPDRERGLAVAKSTGWTALLGSAVIFGLLLLNLAPTQGENWWMLGPAIIYMGVAELLGINVDTPLPLSPTLVLIGLLMLSQLLLVVFASRARAAMGRGRSDGSTLGSIGIAAACLALFVLLFRAGMTLLKEPGHRDPQLERVARVLNQIRESETTYSNTFQQGYSPTLAALGPPPSGTPPSAEAAGLIGEDLARGKAEGYTFRYGNLQWDHGKQLYMVAAHPAEDCQGPCFCSYLLDYSGTVNEEPNPRANFHVIEAKPERPQRRIRNAGRLTVVTSPEAQVYLNEVFKGRAGPDGRLEIENLFPNYYTVLVMLPGSRYFEQRIMVAGGKETTIEATEGQPIKP